MKVFKVSSMQFLTLPRFSKLHSLDVSESDIGYLSVENIGKILPGLKGNSSLRSKCFDLLTLSY